MTVRDVVALTCQVCGFLGLYPLSRLAALQAHGRAHAQAHGWPGDVRP